MEAAAQAGFNSILGKGGEFLGKNRNCFRCKFFKLIWAKKGGGLWGKKRNGFIYRY